jgi:UDP-N-acetylmuramoyl-L-alanyl-D-glutamate--2,6-diaminopimelate ligase
MTKLTSILTSIGINKFTHDVDIKRVISDSRKVIAGDLFVAIPCDQVDRNVQEAASAGAAAIILESKLYYTIRHECDVPMIPVGNPRLILSKLAAYIYSKQPAVNVAVTGTNGKSSVVNFVRQIWEEAGLRAASLGTLGIQSRLKDLLPSTVEKSTLTTPDSMTLHRTLQELKNIGVDYCAFEASSHGLDQSRLHSVHLIAAAFTNFTQDHLDYHQTMEAYFDSKSRLFSEVLPEGKTAVLNADCTHFNSLKHLVTSRKQKLLTYSTQQQSDLWAQNIRLEAKGIVFDLHAGGREWKDIPLQMVGNFQVENVLCAIGLALSSGLSLVQILSILPALKSAKGRMEFAGTTKTGASVFVDYAHTPDALSRSLSALRQHMSSGEGNLVVVFGCGGNRDAGKRSQMGQIAQELADVVYITDDNPRDENPSYIRAQIMMACPNAIEIADRRIAIEESIEKANKNDIVLIAGKGHEQGQLIRGKIHPFDDAQVIRACL